LQLEGLTNLDLEENQTEKILGTVMAYAAGDAFGVPFEFKPKRKIENIAGLEQVEGWPFGGVSDDTLLSLMTIRALTETSPSDGAEKFIRELKDGASSLRGLGPTTRSALGHFITEEEKLAIGNTNGGMMRSALLGLAFSPEDSILRRSWIQSLVSITHKKSVVIECSMALSAAFCVLALSHKEMRSWSIMDIIKRELNEIQASIAETFADFELENWSPHEGGVSLDPIETLKAVIWSVTHGDSVLSTYRAACSLGGDTDTVAALAGSLYFAWRGTFTELLDIEWLEDICWSEIPDLTDAVRILRIGKKSL
jgi:ADP-ribosylglycohydrolase